jgi:hypothetical protein
MNTEQLRDEQLWKTAKKRVHFRKHLISYLIVNAFLWLLWCMQSPEKHQFDFVPWPLWCTLGWGIGIVFSYFNAYVFTGTSAIEKEYEKLKNAK